MIGGEEGRIVRLSERAASALARPGAYLSEEPDGGYGVRLSSDRRRRPLVRVNAPVFEALVKSPGLRPRPSGGWVALPIAPPPSPDLVGRPGVVEGERAVVEGDGRVVHRRANLGESAVAWLARRKGPDGKPWLTGAEVAAADRLRAEYERAGVIGRLTMSWDASPSAGISAPRLEPMERARDAKARIAAALEAVGPGLAPILQQVCFMSSTLEMTERELRFTRGSAKVVLKLALGQLARHYGL